MFHILVPTDFSECSAEAIPYLLEQAELRGASRIRVSLLHVVSIPVIQGPEAVAFVPLDTNEWLTQAEEAAEAEFKRLAGGPLAGLKVTTAVRTTVGPIHDEIIKYAKEQNVDLLIMGTHGRSGFKRLLVGSIAEKVIRSSAKPVLLVPPPTELMPGDGIKATEE